MVQIGDVIVAMGYRFKVAEILYADNYGQRGDDNWDIEFFDQHGEYHHWKQEFDGGYIVH